MTQRRGIARHIELFPDNRTRVDQYQARSVDYGKHEIPSNTTQL